MLKGADVVKVMLRARGRYAEARFYGRDADSDGRRVDTTGYAARLIVEELERAGRRGRSRSGLEKVLRAAGFSDPGRTFAFACDRLARDEPGVRAYGNGRGGLVFRLEAA